MLSFYTCTINDNHIMYGSWCMMDDSWDMERDWLNCLSFCTLFWPYTPLTTQKFKILKKEKKNSWRYFHFTQVYHKWKSYHVWCLICSMKDLIFVILDHIWLFYPTNNLLFGKKRKNYLELLSFHTCVPWITIIWCKVPKIWSTSDRIFYHCEPSFALLPY